MYVPTNGLLWIYQHKPTIRKQLTCVNFSPWLYKHSHLAGEMMIELEPVVVTFLQRWPTHKAERAWGGMSGSRLGLHIYN